MAPLIKIHLFAKDRNVDVRIRAARALGRLGGEEVVLPLVEALKRQQQPGLHDGGGRVD